MTRLLLPPAACIACGKPLNRRPHAGPHTKCCSRRCRNNLGRAAYATANRSLGLPSATVGALGELIVAADLMKQGYEVFRALSPSCSCDLAILRNGRLLRVEVRTGYRTVTGGENIFIGKTGKAHRADVLAVVVHTPNTAIRYDPELSTL